MSSSLFSVSTKRINPEERELIKKLTKIRVSGYKTRTINQEISESNFKMISPFAQEIGDDLLKINLIASKGMKTFKKAHCQLKKIVDELSSFSQVVYAAQLLQYYTILCDKKFNPSGTFQEFQRFLTKYATKLGDVSTNLLVIEYKIIKIYNNLVSLIEEHEHRNESLNSIQKNLVSTKFNLFSTELTALEDAINNGLNDAPDNVFLHYLLFICCYTFAKSYELKYIFQKKQITEKEYAELEKTQAAYLKLANSEINTMCQLNNLITERGFQYVKGLEFFLGQELLYHFPETNIDVMKKHIISLLSEESSKF